MAMTIIGRDVIKLYRKQSPSAKKKTAERSGISRARFVARRLHALVRPSLALLIHRLCYDAAPQ